MYIFIYLYIYIYIFIFIFIFIFIYVFAFYIYIFIFPTLGVGLLDLKLNSSPRPVYSSLIPGVPNPKVSLQCPTLNAQPQSLECPTPECPTLECPTPQSLPGVPSPRLSLDHRVSLSAKPRVSQSLLHPTPECPRSAQPQSVPGVPNPRVSLPREGGDVRSKQFYLFITPNAERYGSDGSTVHRFQGRSSDLTCEAERFPDGFLAFLASWSFVSLGFRVKGLGLMV